MNNLTNLDQLILNEKNRLGSWYNLIKSGFIKDNSWNISSEAKKIFWEDVTQEAIHNFKEMENAFNNILAGDSSSISKISDFHEKRKLLASFIRFNFDDNYKNIFIKENIHLLFKVLTTRYLLNLDPNHVKITKKGNLNGEVDLLIKNKSYSIKIFPISKIWESLGLSKESDLDYLILAGLLEDDWEFLEQVSLGKQLKEQGF